MTNDSIFTATTTWQPVQLNGQDIQNGNFTVHNLSKKTVEFIKAETQPNQSASGSRVINQNKEFVSGTLIGLEKVFCKAGVGTAKLGVVKE